jgi:universal stress protein E
MTYKAKIKKVLVVLSPDLIRPDKPMESALIRRAVSFAKITGCELDLFHVCYDARLDYGLFTSDKELNGERARLTDKDATRLAEMAARLKNECVKVRYEVRWDCPRSDAILRKIGQSRPDLVMKQAREHSYFLGMTTNSDWELARRSPVHIWLVNDDIDDINRIVAAVGNRFGDPADITTATDYNLLRAAGLFGDAFKAEIYPVNAYQIPATPALVAGAAVAPTDMHQETRGEVVRQHNSAVKALAEHFNIPSENVHICEGQPNKVIPDITKAVKADMIVMGAKNIGRLERLVNSVTVEPVMSETSCDILIIRDSDLASVPDAASSPSYGIPKYDLEHAIIDPEDTFESPQQVANVTELSIEFRKRILQAWEHDLRAEMEVENEGGAVRDIDVNALDEIISAKALLEMKQEETATETTRLSGMSA